MAATNYTPIQLYYSTTASAAPVAGNLANGELAINITDGKLYYKDNSGTVQVIATKGAGTIGGSNTQIQYNNSGALAGSSAMTFNSGTNTVTLTTLNLTNALGATYGGTAQSSYTQGDILYSSATNTLSKLGIGTVNYILTSTGSVPQWVAPTSVTVQTANNLAGGAAGSVPYQSAPDTTTFLSIGAANRVMTSSGTAPQWVTALTGLTGVSSSSITNTSLTSGRVVYSTTGGAQTDSSSLTFNGTTLSAGGYSTSGLSTLVKTVTIGNSNFDGSAVFAAATPAKLYIGTGTVTDTTSAIGATNAVGAVSSLAITPIAATNTSVTYTSAATLYIAGAPSAGTNVTITNPYSLWVNDGTAFLNGPVILGSTLAINGAVDFNNTTDSTSPTTGAVVVDGGVGIAKSLYVGGNIVVTKDNSGSYIRLESTAPYAFPGNFTIQAGGQSTPALTITDNTAAQERLNFLTGETVFNQPGADQDFRVESDTNAYALFVDAGNSRVGVNNSSPTVALDVTGDILASGTVTSTSNLFVGGGASTTTPTIDRAVYLQSTTNNSTIGYSMYINDGVNNRRGSMFLNDSTGVFGFDITASSGVPSYKFYRAATEYFGIGDEVVVNEGSNDIDFRVESDAYTHMLFVDAGNSKVGVNTSTPSGTFEVYNNFIYTDTTNIRSYLGQDNNNSTGKAIEVIATNTGSPSNVTVYGLYVDAFNNGSASGTAAFYSILTNRGTAVFNESGGDYDFRVESDTSTHALFVDASADSGAGYVGIRQSNPAAALHITRNSNNLLLSTGSDANYNALFEANYNYGAAFNLNLQGGGTRRNVMEWGESAGLTFNQNGDDMDFRVESDSSTHGLYLDAAQASVSVNTSSTAAFFNVSGSATRVISQELSNSDSQGTAQFNRIVKLCPSVSSNNKLIIPFTSQGSLNSTTVCRVIGHNAAYNTSLPLGFEISFTVGHLSAMYSLSYWGAGGNAVSAALNGQTVEITFTTAYNVAYATSGGVFVTLEYMTNVLGYSIDVANVRLN